MQYDLALVCRDARAHIDVPTAPLAAIRASASERAPRKAGWLTALIAGISIVSVAAAAALGTHVVLERNGGAVITADKFVGKFKDPTAADLQTAVRNSSFHVILPTGLPEGSQLKSIISSNGAVMLRYDLPGAWRASHHLTWIVLANADAIGAPGVARKVTLKFGPHGNPTHWRIGGEEVIVAWNNFTPSEIARMKQAMLTASTLK